MTKKFVYLISISISILFSNCKKSDDSSSNNGNNNDPCQTVNNTTISSDSPVPVGDTLRLSVSTIISGATYDWTGPNGFSSSIANPQINGLTLAASGSYSVTITSGNCTKSLTTSVSIFSSTSPPCIINTFTYNIGTVSSYSSFATTASGNNTYFYIDNVSSGGWLTILFNNINLINGSRVKEGVYRVNNIDSVLPNQAYFDIKDKNIAYTSVSGWICVHNYTYSAVDYTLFTWCDVKIKKSTDSSILTSSGRANSNP